MKRTEQPQTTQETNTPAHALTWADARRIAAFGLLFVLLLTLFSKLMQPTKWFDAQRLQNRNARIAQMMEQKEDTIEIMNIGDSLSLTGFNPMELWKGKGYAAFNIGADGIRMSEAVYAVEEACAAQHPKYLLMESLPLLRYSNKSDMQMLISQPLYHRFPFLKYHSIWKTVIDGPGNKIYHRGYLVNARTDPYLGEADYLTDRRIKDTYVAQVPALNRWYFRRIHRFCEQRGITLILYSMPSPEIYNLPRVELMQAFAGEEGVPYIDLNRHVAEIGIDWAADTSDAGDHLNVYGSRKATLYLAGCLEELAGGGEAGALAGSEAGTTDTAGESGAAFPPLTDHRADPAYQDWNEEIPAYDALVEKMKGKNFGDL